MKSSIAFKLRAVMKSWMKSNKLKTISIIICNQFFLFIFEKKNANGAHMVCRKFVLKILFFICLQKEVITTVTEDV